MEENGWRLKRYENGLQGADGGREGGLGVPVVDRGADPDFVDFVPDARMHLSQARVGGPSARVGITIGACGKNGSGRSLDGDVRSVPGRPRQRGQTRPG